MGSTHKLTIGRCSAYPSLLHAHHEIRWQHRRYILPQLSVIPVPALARDRHVSLLPALQWSQFSERSGSAGLNLVKEMLRQSLSTDTRYPSTQCDHL